MTMSMTAFTWKKTPFWLGAWLILLTPLAFADDLSWVVGSPTMVPTSGLQSLVNKEACPVPSNAADNANMHAWGFGPKTAILENGCWGGVIYQYWWDGHEFENANSPGAAINVAFNQYKNSDPSFVTQNPFANPTQAGDLNGHGSHLLEWGYWGDYPNYTGMWTATEPLNFNNPNADIYANADPSTAYVYPNIQITTGVVPQFANSNNVTAFETTVQLNAAAPYTLLQIPAVYLKANFDTVYTFDVMKQKLTPLNLPTPPCNSAGNALDTVSDKNAYHWNGGAGSNANTVNTFKSMCGVMLATDKHSDFDQGYTFGVYGCTPDLGGSVTQFDTYNGSCNAADISPTSWNSVVIYPEYFSEAPFGSPLPQGSKTFLSFFITGPSMKSVTDQATALYKANVR